MNIKLLVNTSSPDLLSDTQDVPLQRLQVQAKTQYTSEKAKLWVTELEELYEELKKNILDAQACYQTQADTRQTPTLDIQIEDLVFVLAKFIWTMQPSKKLAQDPLCKTLAMTT